MLKKINDAKCYINGLSLIKPDIGIILGSGLGDLANEIEDPIVINYCDIPNFPVTTVEGHTGKLFLGKLSGKNVCAMQGRFHYYEGYRMDEVIFPIRVMNALGISTLIITNAAGGLRNDLVPGSIMLIKDHIFTGVNPLIGKNYSELGERFPDMSEAYSKELITVAKNAAETLKINISEGVYYYVSGPSYETEAELRMLIRMGADAVGMSSAPEVIAAAHLKMQTLGISCITDLADPDNMQKLAHEEVIRIANETKPKMAALVKKVLKEYKN